MTQSNNNKPKINLNIEYINLFNFFLLIQYVSLPSFTSSENFTNCFYKRSNFHSQLTCNSRIAVRANPLKSFKDGRKLESEIVQPTLIFQFTASFLSSADYQIFMSSTDKARKIVRKKFHDIYGKISTI